MGVGSVGSGPSLSLAELAQAALEATERNPGGTNQATVPPVGGGGSDSAPVSGRPVLDAPRLDAGAIGLILLELRNKVDELQLGTARQGVELKKQQAESTHKANMEKLQDIVDNMEKSKKSGVFGKVFGWIGAALSLVVGVAATIATGGAAWPLLAVAVMNVAVMVAQETGVMDKVMEGLGKMFAEMLKSFGMDEKEAEKVGAIVAQVAVMAAILAANVVAALASGGASATSTLAQVASFIKGVAQIAQGVAMVGQGASQIATSVHKYEADDARADSAELMAFLRKIQAQQEEEMETIQRIVEQMQSNASAVIDMIKGDASTMESILTKMRPAV